MANIQLVDNLRRLRKQYNYTQAQIGKKLHITHQAYSNYETGVREPNLQLLAELSWIYHTSVDSLITQYCNAKNPSSVEVKNYFCIKIENSENDILLTKNEVNLLLKYRSKKQVKEIERYHVPNEMTFNDEGIQVEFADKKETYEWEQIQKVVTTPKTIGFYYETEKALIVPKPDFGDKFVPILTLATKKLGPARVHLR